MQKIEILLQEYTEYNSTNQSINQIKMCGSCVTNSFTSLTEAQKRAIKRSRAGKVKLVIVDKCYTCQKEFPVKDLKDSGRRWHGKKCEECLMKEQEDVECVICGEMKSGWVECKGGNYCCDECFAEVGTRCWRCRSDIIPEIESEEMNCDTHAYYFEHCDNGDCCADCMQEIVEEHQEEIECVHNIYECNKCEFATLNDDPDCSKCGASFCMMAKSVPVC